MKLLRSCFVWAVLLMVLYATWQVIKGDGWLTGAVFLAIVIVCIGAVIGIRDSLFSLFSCRRER